MKKFLMRNHDNRPARDSGEVYEYYTIGGKPIYVTDEKESLVDPEHLVELPDELLDVVIPAPWITATNDAAEAA